MRCCSRRSTRTDGNYSVVVVVVGCSLHATPQRVRYRSGFLPSVRPSVRPHVPPSDWSSTSPTRRSSSSVSQGVPVLSSLFGRGVRRTASPGPVGRGAARPLRRVPVLPCSDCRTLNGDDGKRSRCNEVYGVTRCLSQPAIDSQPATAAKHGPM